MGMMINKEAYQKLIKEDVSWLLNNTEDDLERWHILAVLKESVNRIYKYKGSEDREFEEWWAMNVKYEQLKNN